MDFDLNTALTGAALLLAIASPIITALINAHTKRLEMENILSLQHKIEVFEEYARCAGQYISYNSAEAKAAYGAALGKALVYANDYTAVKMLSLDREISVRSGDWTNDRSSRTDALYEIVCELLSGPSWLKNKKCK